MANGVRRLLNKGAKSLLKFELVKYGDLTLFMFIGKYISTSSYNFGKLTIGS